MTSWDLLITGGEVVDGTGGPVRRADVAVLDGKVAAVGDVGTGPAARTVDATGRWVCPGFVDVHTHSDLTLLSNPEAHSKVRQGVTTEVVGNCGLGVAPLTRGADVGAIRAAVSYLDVDPAVAWTWRDQADYLDAVAAARPSVNVAALVAHLPLRAGVVGFDDREADADDLEVMSDLLADSLEAGAVGLSTGLMYAPLVFARRAELEELGRVVADYDRVFAWHLRDYADDLLVGVREAIEIAERTGCRTQISHLVAVGQRNWGGVGAALELVDAARARGVDVGVDIYPYLAGNAPLSQRLPAWAQAGGDLAMRLRLHDPDIVERVRREWADSPLSWDDITINGAPSPAGDAVTGRVVGEIARELGVHPDVVALDALAEFGNAVTMVAGGRDEGDLVAALTHAASVIGSDGQALDPTGPTGTGVPHPRSYGCYPRLFAEFVRPGVLPVAEAVAKCSGAAAARVGLRDRGVLAADAAADIVIIDPDRVTDRATFAEPHQFPDGIDMVVVNGRVVVDHDGHTSERSGTVLRAS